MKEGLEVSFPNPLAQLLASVLHVSSGAVNGAGSPKVRLENDRQRPGKACRKITQHSSVL